MSNENLIIPATLEQDGQIKALAALVLEQTREVLRAKGYDSQVDREQVEIKPGRKYTRIDRGPHGGSGYLMIEHATGYIYGIKGYGVPHRGHRYGTLDTADQWYWGEYAPRHVHGEGKA
jgi:hypothetical protein